MGRILDLAGDCFGRAIYSDSRVGAALYLSAAAALGGTGLAIMALESGAETAAEYGRNASKLLKEAFVDTGSDGLDEFM